MTVAARHMTTESAPSTPSPEGMPETAQAPRLAEGLELLVVGSRPGTAEGHVSISAASEYLVETATSSVLIVARGVVFDASESHVFDANESPVSDATRTV